MVPWPRAILIALLLGRNGMVITAMTPEGAAAARDAPSRTTTMRTTATTTAATEEDDNNNSSENDDDWWSDAEEIDLTTPFRQDQFLLPPSGEGRNDDDEGDFYPEEDVDGEMDSGINYLDHLQEFFTSNESCFWDIECDDFSKMSLPPDFEGTMPPPPLPPFLRELEEFMREGPPRLRDSHGSATVVELREERMVEGKNCLLCEWAKAGNKSSNFWTRRKDANMDFGGAMVGSLIGVALLSAVAGAAFMGVLLRCKKLKNADPGRDIQCLFLGRRNFKCSSSSSEGREGNNGTQGVTEHFKNENPASSSNTRIGWPMRLWRRGSSQAPLQRHSSTGSENSYSEEPYVNVDGVYAELNPTLGCKGPQGLPQGISLCPSNTYSEIPDPVRPSDLNICSRLCGQEGTYENSGYVLSETPSEPNESSAGSTSTPSSAYYSDVSTCEVQSNKKKKKKRKSEDRLHQHHMAPPVTCSTVTQRTSALPVISNQIPLRPVHLNIGTAPTVQPRCCHPQRDSVPLTIQHLPLKHHTITESAIGEIHNPSRCVNNLPLQPSFLHLNLRGNCEDSDLFPFRYPTSLPRDIHYEGELLMRHCEVNNIQRPLPPLPSRQVTGPQRRLDSQAQETSVTLPSEYI